MLSSPDARLSLGLLMASLLSLAAFLWTGFGEIPARWNVVGQPLIEPAGGAPGTRFVDSSERLGLGQFFHNSLPLDGPQHSLAPGVALLDLDADQDLDLVLLGGPGNALGVSIFINTGGEPRFEDRSEELGIHWQGNAQGVCAGDYDNDGDVDLFITAIGPNLLLANLLQETGQLGFEDRSEAAGLRGGSYHAIRTPSGLRVEAGPGEEGSLPVAEFSTGASFGDFDQDGRLDLYVANLVSDNPSLRRELGSSAHSLHQPPQKDRLYHNEGGGRFKEVTRLLHVEDPQGRSISAVFFQADDRLPEILCAQIGVGNKVLRNLPHGQPLRAGFERQEGRYGLADSGDSMGVAIADADNDGDLDILVTKSHGPHALFSSFQNTPAQVAAGNPPVRYEERANRSGIAALTDGRNGRGAVFFDYDNDGLLDLAIAHGSDQPDPGGLRCRPDQLLLFHNLGGGQFEEVGAAAGLQDQLYCGRGLVAGDFDGDEDLDLVLAQNNGPVILFENLLQDSGHSQLTIAPTLDPIGRAEAIGMKALVQTMLGTQQQQVISGGSYLSQGPLRLHFGLGRERKLNTRLISPYPDRIRDFSQDSVADLPEQR